MSKRRIVHPSSFVLPLLVAACSAACVRDGGEDSSSMYGRDALSGSSSMPRLPWSGGTGSLAPWGGSDATRWRPEAIMANAMSQALNDAWSRTNVKDAVVAAPVKMQNSGFREFGDGQANAAPSFEWWRESRPPVVATLVTFNDGTQKMVLVVDRAMPNTDATWDLQYTVGGSSRVVSLPIARGADGQGHAEWTVPAEIGWTALTSAQVALVHPHTWGDWFPIWFRFPVKPISALKAEVPSTLAHYADGGDITDHEGVSLQSHAGTDSPFQRLSAHSFSPAYNPTPFIPVDIHARFPWGGHEYVTGVGKGWTWVSDVPAAPFKIMYTCFDARDQAAETNASDGGVPSGGGWHRIGDPAETVLNDLEDGPIVLGSAMNNPLPQSMLPGGSFAYNLSDVATIRWVRPGEAFVTPTGGSFTDGAGTTWDQSNYHWYFFANARPVCTEEWVHPCTPTSYGFSCSAQSQVSFQVDGATTSWGQNVYVVGDAKELGGWDPNAAIQLSPTSYPSWTGTVALPRGANVHFKFIKKSGTGVVWEGGGDHALSVPAAATGAFSSTWQ